MKYHKLNITQEDIDKGVRHDGEFCVISQAIRRSMTITEDKTVITSFFGIVRIFEANKTIEKKFGLSPEGQELVREFDAGYKIFPQTVEMKEI